MFYLKIKSIHVTNFKSFKEFNFDFKKINVILGPNNSGKSNILKLLLLLKQTFTSSLKAPLILNGNIINLGSYKDITYKFNNRKIGIDFQISSPFQSWRYIDPDIEELNYDLKLQYFYDEKQSKIYFSDVKISEIGKNFQILDFQKDKKIILNNRSKDKYLSDIKEDLKNLITQLDSFPKFPVSNIPLFKQFHPELNLAPFELHNVSDLKEVFDYFKNMFLLRPSSNWDLNLDYSRKFITIDSSDLGFLELFYDIKTIIDLLNTPAIKDNLPSKIRQIINNCYDSTRIIIKSFELLKNVDSHLYRIEEGFSAYCKGIHYIGPIRENPERYYSITGEVAESVGFKGEFVPYLLKKSKEELGLRDYKLIDLDKKVQKWLMKFEMAKGIEIKQHKEIELISIFLREFFSGVKVNLTDMGFGTSQVLPIILEGFLSDRDPVLMIEQPEIHLHPKAQSVLGDLFIEIANEDKTIIVETHSEHLIRRIQRRIAENKISKDDVIFYYVNIGKEGSKLQELKIDEDGFIENIPEGFFDENYEEASEHLRIISEKKENKK